jgi:predicted DCC family thiol-disulfide oxidoreductase YuxK
MQQNATGELKGDVYFVYDGDCPICTTAAHALRIREAVGPLHLINAREGADQPLVREVTNLGYDLDEGMVIKFGGRYYHGADALGIMALLGSETGWFNRMNAALFRSPHVAKLLYPAMRGTRNTLIRLMGISKLNNLVSAEQMPTFKPIFGEAWQAMPPVLHQHYANRPYTRDSVTVEGIMEVRAARLMQLFAPLLKWSGLLVPYQGQQVPTTVTFRSEPDSRVFRFDRDFRFPGKAPYHFRSRMMPVGGNEVIEYMSLGIGWRAAYRFAEGKVTLTHRGYVWRVLGLNIPMPFHWLFGKGYAEEEATAENSFRMRMDIRHPWFGEVYAYSGDFKIKEVKLDA